MKSYHNTLCPKLWTVNEDGAKLDNEVRNGLLKVAQDFVKELKDNNNISIEVDDIVIIGSATNYNWTNYSDIDLHVVTDYKKLDMSAEDAQTLFDAIKVGWNNKHNITMKGHDVEIYVQDKAHIPTSASEYSVLNDKWIKGAQQNKLVVGSQARILYADAEGRVKIAEAFNDAINKGEIGTVILGRDHHDVSGTDSPYRETSNIYDGSRFTADMAIQNVIGDSFRGATWVSIHNGGGVGWGEVINGGFGMVLDGSKEASKRLQSMLFWDVNNGISRRSWARNEGAIFAIKRAMEAEPLLKVTLPNSVDDSLLN